MRVFRSRQRRVQALAIAVMLIATEGLCAERSLTSSVEGRTSYNDNISLTPGTRDGVWGLHLSPSVALAWREALTEVAAEGRLGLNKHPSRGDLNTTDALGELRLTTATERTTYGLTARVNRDSTLATEARQTGVVQARRQRLQKQLSPSVRRQLTDRTSASLRYQYNAVDYETGAGLRDYADHQLSTGYSWLASERLRTETTLGWDDLRTDDDSVRTGTVNLSQGLSLALTERVTFGASAGWRRSKTTVNSLVCPFGPQILCDLLGVAPVNVARTSKARGLILSADADFDLERGRYGLSISRGTSPTGNGLTVRSDRLGGRWNSNLTEKITGGLSAAWVKSVYDGDLAARSRYMTLDASVDWRLDERWTAGARYGYVRSRTDGTPGSASANALYFTLSYQWPRVALE